MVVKINDQCTDPGYCDQTDARDVNTRYGKQVHFDLCNATGVTGQFFGEVAVGVVMGLAQRLEDCSALDDGAFGSELGTLGGGVLDGEGETIILPSKLASEVVAPTGAPIVSDAFRIAGPKSVVSSGVVASSASVPISSAASANGGGVPTYEYVVDGNNEDDSCEDEL